VRSFDDLFPQLDICLAKMERVLEQRPSETTTFNVARMEILEGYYHTITQQKLADIELFWDSVLGQLKSPAKPLSSFLGTCNTHTHTHTHTPQD